MDSSLAVEVNRSLQICPKWDKNHFFAIISRIWQGNMNPWNLSAQSAHRVRSSNFDGFGLGVRKKYLRQVLLSGRFTSKTSDVISTFLPGSTRAKFRIIPDKLIDLLSSKAVRGTVGIIYFKIFFFWIHFRSPCFRQYIESELNFRFQLENGWARFLTAIELVWTWFRFFFILSFSHVLLYMDYQPEVSWTRNRKCNETKTGSISKL